MIPIHLPVACLEMVRSEQTYHDDLWTLDDFAGRKCNKAESN